VCGRISERSCHTWFVLTVLLGYLDVRNYEGSWTEWGNLVRTWVYRFTAATTTLLAPNDFVIRLVLSDDDFAK